MTDEPERSMQDVVREDGRYPQEAFAFLHDGLNRAVAHMRDDGASGDVEGTAAGEQKHVTGAQLCLSTWLPNDGACSPRQSWRGGRSEGRSTSGAWSTS